MTNKKGIVLLSSGLDSYVSLACAREKMTVELAITFDYGQRAAEDEIFASKKIAEFFNIEHKVIKLPFLSEILDNALSNKNSSLETEELGIESAKMVWVPNRNGLFLNIGAMYCDKFDIDYIVFGANKEEGETFCDNTAEFCMASNNFFSLSTQKKPVIFAPLVDLYKPQIVDTGFKLGIDFSLIKSCYDFSYGSKKHCGVCESCKRLYNAIIKSGHNELIDIIF